MSVRKGQIEELQSQFKNINEFARNLGYQTGPYPRGKVTLDDVYYSLPEDVRKLLLAPFKQETPVITMPPPPPASDVYPDFEEKAKKRGTVRPERLFSKEMVIHDLGSGDVRRALRGSVVGPSCSKEYVGSKMIFHTPAELEGEKRQRQNDVEESFCGSTCWEEDNCPKRSPVHLNKVAVGPGYVDYITDSPSWGAAVSFFTSFNVLTHFEPAIQHELFSKPGIHMAPNWGRMNSAMCAVPSLDADKCVVHYGGQSHEEYKVVATSDLTIPKAQVYDYHIIFPRGDDFDLSNPTNISFSHEHYQERPPMSRPTPRDFKEKTHTKVWKLKRDGKYTSVVITAPRGGVQHLIMGPYGPHTEQTFVRYEIPKEHRMIPCSAYFERYTKRLYPEQGEFHEFFGFGKVYMTPVRVPLIEQRKAFDLVFGRIMVDGKKIFSHPQLMTGPNSLRTAAAAFRNDPDADGISDVGEIDHSCFKDVQSVDIRLNDLEKSLEDIGRAVGMSAVAQGIPEEEDNVFRVYEFDIAKIDEYPCSGADEVEGPFEEVLMLTSTRHREEKYTTNNRKRVMDTARYAVDHPNPIDELLG